MHVRPKKAGSKKKKKGKEKDEAAMEQLMAEETAAAERVGSYPWAVREYISAHGRADCAPRAIQALSNLELKPNEWMKELQQMEAEGMLQEFLAACEPTPETLAKAQASPSWPEQASEPEA